MRLLVFQCVHSRVPVQGVEGEYGFWLCSGVIWAGVVSWVLEILHGIVSGTFSASEFVAALPMRRSEGPGSSGISEGGCMRCGVSGSESSFRRACIFAAGDLSAAGAFGILDGLVSLCGRFPGAPFMLPVPCKCLP